MPYPIEKKLVIAVSSSAVFDMGDADAVFRADGEEAYRKFQVQRIAAPFDKGVAFPFVSRLLRLNDEYPDEKPIEVVVLSRNDPDSGRRFYRSCNYYGLDITRGAFLTGKSPYPYVPAFNASLFLSATKADVAEAVDAGLPAGLVLPTTAIDDNERELRMAFDFDGVLADDAAEQIYQQSHNLDLFHASETKNAGTPHAPGPLKDLLTKISFFQKLEAKRAREDPSYSPIVRIAIVTARNAPSNERLVTTLNSWGISPSETFFLGGIEKRRILDVLKPHIFFDDQLVHLQPAASTVPSVHVPFGVANRRVPSPAITVDWDHAVAMSRQGAPPDSAGQQRAFGAEITLPAHEVTAIIAQTEASVFTTE